jgi:hypothetical protein
MLQAIVQEKAALEVDDALLDTFRGEGELDIVLSYQYIWPYKS